VVSTNGLEEGRFQSLVEEVQQRRQQEVVEKEVTNHHRTFGESYSKGRRKPALRLFHRNFARASRVVIHMRIPLLAAASLLLLAASAAARDVTHDFQAAVPRGTVQRVVIAIPTGTFTIRNGAADKLALSGIASRDYDGAKERAWAQKVVDDTTVEFVVKGAEAIVRRKFGANAKSWRAMKFTGIDLRLDLPPGIDVDFDTTAGEIDMAGNFGDVDIDLRAGEVDVRIPRARVRELNASCRIGEVRTHLGNEVVTREGLFPDKTHFFNGAGTAHVNVHVTAGEVDVTLTQ
jgi:opacity protein-like surface antigen